MAGITRYDVPAEFSYNELPFQEVLQAGAFKQKNQDIAKQELDLLGKPFGSLEADTELARSIKAEYDTKLAELSGKDLTNATNRKALYDLKRQYINDYGPQGRVGAIVGNLEAHQAYIKDLGEKLKKGPKEGGISQKDYDKLSKISLDQYKGIGEGGPKGYNKYSGITPASYSDIADQADKLAKDWKANAVKSGSYYDSKGNIKTTADGQFYKKTSSGLEQVKESEIYNNILPILQNDPMNKAYAAQQTMLDTYGQEEFFGVDENGNEIQYNPEYYTQKHYNDQFTRPATFAANKYGFKQTSYDEELKGNPLGQYAAQKALNEQDIPSLDVTGTTTDVVTKEIDSKYSGRTYDSKGNIIPKVTQSAPNSVGPGAVLTPGGKSYTTQEDIRKAAIQKTELNNRKTSFYKNITTLINSKNAEERKAGLRLQKEAKDFTSDQKWDNYFNNIEKNSAISYSQDMEMSPDAQEYFTKGYGKGELLGRTITKADGTPIILADYLKEEYPDKEPLDALKNVELTRVRAIGTKGNKEMAGSFYATLSNGEKVLVQPSDQQKEVFRPLGAIADFALNGPDEGEGENIQAGIKDNPAIYFKPINYTNHVLGKKETKIQATIYNAITGEYTPISPEALEIITGKKLEDIQDLKSYTKDKFDSSVGKISAVKKTNEFILPESE